MALSDTETIDGPHRRHWAGKGRRLKGGLVPGWEETGWSGQDAPEGSGARRPEAAPEPQAEAWPGYPPPTYPPPPYSPYPPAGSPPGYTGPYSAARDRRRSTFELAGWWSRAFASIVDGFVLGFATLVLGLTMGRAGYVAAIVFNVAYLTLLIGTGAGQTVGMRILRIGIADVDTRLHPIGIPPAALRAIVFWLMTLVPFVALLSVLWPIWDPLNQTLHDKVVRSVATVRS